MTDEIELTDEQQAELDEVAASWGAAKKARDEALEAANELPARNDEEIEAKEAAIAEAKDAWTAAKEDLLERERTIREGS